MGKSATVRETRESIGRDAGALLEVVADAVLLTSTILVEGGCETQLAEDTASAMGSSYRQVDECTVFVMLTGIMVSEIGRASCRERV